MRMISYCLNDGNMTGHDPLQVERFLSSSVVRFVNCIEAANNSIPVNLL